jgi:hypothetical protein
VVLLGVEQGIVDNKSHRSINPEDWFYGPRDLDLLLERNLKLQLQVKACSSFRYCLFLLSL